MALLDMFRRPPQPDEFEARVRELVSIHGPNDALEADRALRVGMGVLLHGLVETNNRIAAGAPPSPDLDRSRFYRRVAADVERVASSLISGRVSDPGTVAQLISTPFFGSPNQRQFLDTDEIPLLIGIAYGVAILVRQRDPELAALLLTEPGEPRVDGGAEGFSAFEKELLLAIIEYGATDDEDKVGPLSALYERAIGEVPQSRRRSMLLDLVGLVEERKLSTNTFMPFLFVETDFQVISTAALHFAGVAPGEDGNGLFGVSHLTDYARLVSQRGEDLRAAAILAGLVALGDRRVFALVGPCWRFLSQEGRSALAAGVKWRTHAPLVDWLISWLEECEGDEFGAVAGTLARIPSITRRDEWITAGVLPADSAPTPELEVPADIVEVRRAFPVWSVPENEVITHLQRYSMQEYRDRIRPRLLQIAANETAPRIMNDVLKQWGIDHTGRLFPGIVMQAPISTEPPRQLLPLLPAADAGVLFDLVPLEDRDFLARDGQLLLSWAIFNPYGPTWSCLGLLPTEDPDTDLLFFRMLNPFRQISGAVASVHGQQRSSVSYLLDLVGRAFERHDFGEDEDGPVALLGTGAPSLVLASWELGEAFSGPAPACLLRSPAIRGMDLTADITLTRQTYGSPWDRATAGFRLAMERAAAASQGNGIEERVASTPAQREEWLSLISETSHQVGEMFALPCAWHGSIDQVDGAMAHYAFTFWQLDEFLGRYGFSAFREVAEAIARRATRDELEQEGP